MGKGWNWVFLLALIIVGLLSISEIYNNLTTCVFADYPKEWGDEPILAPGCVHLGRFVEGEYGKLARFIVLSMGTFINLIILIAVFFGIRGCIRGLREGKKKR